MNRIACFLVLLTSLLLAGAPLRAAQPDQVNPTASSVKAEDALLRALQGGGTVDGRVSIPDAQSSILIQPQGRAWQDFRQSSLPLIGAVSVLGMAVVIALFYMVRGKIMIDHGLAGRTIQRFTSFERFAHWLTASCFLVLALSGLNVAFGKVLLLPLLGHETFTVISQAGKLAHNYLAFPFIIGLVLMFLVWVKDNIPDATDANWVKEGGGLLTKGKHPPAKKFNAGQKVIFWSVVGGGAALSVSGIYLLFPYLSAGGVVDQQFWSTIHGVVAVLLVAVMIAHIYIGSVGMQGAFDAMGSGQVDLNWAKEHHALWVEETQAKKRAAAE